jgi:hypothetical protein
MLLILAADEQFLVGLVIVTLVAIFFLYAIPIQFLWSNFSFFPHKDGLLLSAIEVICTIYQR